MSTKTETRRSYYVDQARGEVLDLYRDGYATLDEIEGWAENGDIHEAAHEFADGHEVAIYYHHQDALLASGVLDDFGGDADDMMDQRDDETASDFVRRYIGTLVWLFLTDCYTEGHAKAVATIREIDGESE